MSGNFIGGTIPGWSVGITDKISYNICGVFDQPASADLCTLTPSDDFGTTPGSCAVAEDSAASHFCTYNEGTANNAGDGWATADSCSATAYGCSDAAIAAALPNDPIVASAFQGVASAVDTLEESIYAANKSMDYMWLLLGGSLVFFMHSGFALLEVGSVSVRNTQNILFKNVISPTVAAILFWAFGYTIAYGSNACNPEVVSGFMGSSCYYFMTDVVVADADGAGYDGGWYAGWFFQWAFCATASTIVSGAVAERIVFKVYVVITVFLTAFIYPVVVHWGWSTDGWASAFNSASPKLFGVGVVDFAGSGIVHMTGGVAALVAAILVGPRHGRFVTQYCLPKNGKDRWYAMVKDQPLVQMTSERWMEIVDDSNSPSGETWKAVRAATMKELDEKGVGSGSLKTRVKTNPFPCQSPTFQTFGCLILWFGWYGFNCVSTLIISGGYSGIAAKVAVTTTLAAAGGAISAGLLTYVLDGDQDLGAMSNGILAGLVSITSACPAVEPWAAIVIGLLGGLVYYLAVKLLDALHIDDVVLAIPVHCFCGMWGVLAVGLFASPQAMAVAYGSGGCGLFYAGHELCTAAGDQFMAQLVFVLAIIAWVASTTTIVLLGAKVVLGSLCGFEYTDDHKNPLAYSPEMQMLGMDQVKHGGMSGSETTTVYSQKPNPASTNLKNPTQGAVNPRKRRSSVVGQVVVSAVDSDEETTNP